ncbi:putative membrane protein [Mycetocola sp. CAN_C7]|uniref:YhgE/Pip domain-containing protein n=1 Tax=Mycetocola sp. CAN_C7 TaxID=2787724 RepID=UPI0018CB2E0E
MTTPLARFESARASGRVTWLSVLGIVLVPLVVAGVLVWAFWNPQDRLDQVRGAIVNNDSPVEVDGQTVPLGRQLSAGLVGGAGDSADADTNYTWVLTDEDDADAGLASGDFAAVVTIPENFSAAATSFSGDAADAEKATIDVTTSDKSRLVDDAVSQVITTTAADLVGNELTTSYLENIYLGFNTLGDELGTAADGASQLGDGASALADGASNLADGTVELSTGASGLASGVSSYTDGVSQLSGGLAELSRQTADLPTQTQGLATGAAGVSTGVDSLISTIDEQSALLVQVAQGCDPVLDPYCAAVLTYLQEAQQAAAANPNAAAQLSAGAQAVATGSQSLADGIPALSGGISQVAGAAATLAGAGTELDSGASQLAGGVSELSTGATGIADGATGVSDGVAELATGLSTAVDALPTYSDSERTNLAEVVAKPVVADGDDALAFGASGVPFYAALALWLGAFASLLVLRAKPVSVLGSTRPSAVLALRAWLPAAAVGAVQGVLLAAILQPLVELDAGGWIGLAAVSVVIAVAFSATNQALNAVFGGAGRFIAMVVALVLIGTSIIATAPTVLGDIAAVLPVQPAVDAVHAVIGSGAGLPAALTGLVLWTVGALAATTLAIARSRTVSVRKLVPHAA